MKVSALEFRLRVAIIAIAISLGFWAPWIEAWHLGRRVTTLEWGALTLARHGLLPFSVATPAFILLASIFAAIAVVLRVSGTAYMGAYVVNHPEMQAGPVRADGPYCYLRNPLYLGTWCMIAAMSAFMPPTGALFALTLITLFLLRLTLGEETFLAARLGEPYRAYCAMVPRFLPQLRGTPPPAGERPDWVRGTLAELGPIGIFIAVAGISWSYESMLVIKAIVVSFGVSLVARALLPRSANAPQP